MKWTPPRALLSAMLSLAVTAATSSFAATSAEIEAAISKGRDYLYSVQAADGTWESVPGPQKDATDQSANGGQYSGHTALIVYALLSAGDKASDPKLSRAVEFLKKTDTLGTYALGVRCQVWLMLPQTPDVKQRMQKDSQILVRTMRTQGDAQGMYDYMFDKGNGYSHSRSQYAVLGVWAAERSGIKVPEGYWPVVEKAWIRNQDPSGGWTYQHPVSGYQKEPLTPGMTAVGVATLFITQDYVRSGATCSGNVDSAAITKGLKWMGDNMDKVATDKSYDRDFPLPTLYAVERIGVAAGVKYIGGVDWYQKGATWLVMKQNKNGAWTVGASYANAPYQSTAFALLFLARGRAPLVMNKLDFSTDPAKPAGWNQRPRDVANVVRWISSNTERDLGWQSVDLKAPLKDLAEAPILYLAGSDELTFTDEHKAKLKAFVEAGGLILAHADCGKPGFSTSFRKLAGELYPTYEFRELPEASPVYGVFNRAKWKTKPSVLSVSNGAREIMMLIPTSDPARAWQTRQVVGKEEMYQLAANIFLYATNKEKLQYRGESYIVTPDPAIKPTKTIEVARLQYDGNWDPEPGGWRRLSGIFHNTRKLGLTVNTVKLGTGDFGKAKFAHMTGTGKFVLKPEQIDALKKFVDSGGTVFIDAAGGDGEFATAAEALATTIAPSGKLATLAADAAFLKDVKDLRYRTYARMKGGAGSTNAARLQAVDVNGRPAVIVSRDDLSVGLLGPEMDGIIGYEPQTAVDIMSAAILGAQPK